MTQIYDPKPAACISREKWVPAAGVAPFGFWYGIFLGFVRAVRVCLRVSLQSGWTMGDPPNDGLGTDDTFTAARPTSRAAACVSNEHRNNTSTSTGSRGPIPYTYWGAGSSRAPNPRTPAEAAASTNEPRRERAMS